MSVEVQRVRTIRKIHFRLWLHASCDDESHSYDGDEPNDSYDDENDDGVIGKVHRHDSCIYFLQEYYRFANDDDDQH